MHEDARLEAAWQGRHLILPLAMTNLTSTMRGHESSLFATGASALPDVSDRTWMSIRFIWLDVAPPEVPVMPRCTGCSRE